MSDKDRIPLADARVVADTVVSTLEPACERIEIAGSVRRGATDCGDIEVVCIPKLGEPGRNLFGEAIGEPPDELHDLCERLRADGVLVPRQNKLDRISWGRKLKWVRFVMPQGSGWWPCSFALDIYVTTPEQWGVTLAIRTGPADFSHRLVTPKAAGGYCPAPLQFKGWRVVERASGEPLPTPEEADVFRALGMDWIAPDERS